VEIAAVRHDRNMIWVCRIDAYTCFTFGAIGMRIKSTQIYVDPGVRRMNEYQGIEETQSNEAQEAL
jgi:hypothetical protein